MDCIEVKDRVFTLNTKNTTYQFMADKYNNLLHLYYGRKTAGCMDYLLVYKDCGFSPNPAYVEKDRTYSFDILSQEFPVRGNGDFRSPCFDVKYSDTSWGVDLHYKSHKIINKKYTIPNLPCVYQNEGDNAQSLEITLFDEISKIEVRLLYGVLPNIDIITRSVVVKNCGLNAFTVEKLQSACLDFVAGDYDFIKFYGRHALERNFERSEIGHFSSSVQSRRGTSSHQYSPFVIVAQKDATENFGDCYGLNFVYSGGFKAEAEKDQFMQTRIQMGLNDEMFSYNLKPSEEFFAPEVILSFSNCGFSKLSQNFHKCIKNNICRGKFKNAIRPILLNCWEASYFDFDANSILELAKEASKLGIEMLVLDDGWFGNRNDDNSSLGDWFVNEKKLGTSLKEMVKNINALGLKFGIWFEPEMISEDSELYKKHPEYVLQFKDRKAVRGRNQLVLNFSNKKVVAEIFKQMCAVLDSANIEYVKWDFNRSICDVFDAEIENQGMVLHNFVLGLYSLLERLTQKYPNILFEGCSGGGGRFDCGMLYYTPQIWLSDNTDAVDRTYIQYGSSFGFPLCTMGSHVSICPNHQTGRTVPMKTRGVVATSGTFGYELNLCKISAEEKCQIKEQIKTFKKYAFLIQNGEYWRLSSPFEKAVVAWQIISEDKTEFLLNYVVKETHGYMPNIYIKLCGLKSGTFYKEQNSGKIFPADALMQVGFPITQINQIYQAEILHFVQC